MPKTLPQALGGRSSSTAGRAMIAYAAMAIVCLLGGGLLVQRFAQLWPWTIDDSFITYRYARHLALGEGLRWNVGESPVQGFTSFAWVLVNVIPHWLALDPPGFAKIVSLVAMAGSAVCAALLCRELLRDLDAQAQVLASAAAALLVIGHPITAIHAASGMETALSTLLTTMVAWRACASGPRASSSAGWVLALSCLALGLTRPEGNLLAVTALAMWSRRERNLGYAWHWQPLLCAYVIPGALYFCAQWAFFAAPFPLPLYVKSATAWSGVPEVIRFYRDGVAWLCVPAALGFFAFRKELAHVIAALALHSIFFLYPNHLMGYWWRYLFPYFPLLMVAAVIGIVVVARKNQQAGAAALGAAVVWVALWVRSSNAMISPYIAYAQGLARAHVQLGHDLVGLGHALGGRPRLVISDAGAVPYYSDWLVLDSYGLNDRVIARSAERDLNYVFENKPEIVTVLSSEADSIVPLLPFELPIAVEADRRGYQAAAVYKFGAKGEPPYGGYYIWVLARSDLAEISRRWLVGSTIIELPR